MRNKILWAVVVLSVLGVIFQILTISFMPYPYTLTRYPWHDWVQVVEHVFTAFMAILLMDR